MTLKFVWLLSRVDENWVVLQLCLGCLWCSFVWSAVPLVSTNTCCSAPSTGCFLIGLYSACDGA